MPVIEINMRGRHAGVGGLETKSTTHTESFQIIKIKKYDAQLKAKINQEQPETVSQKKLFKYF